MIKKSLFAAIMFFVLYTLFTGWMDKRNKRRAKEIVYSQNIWQGNRIKAQKFIYEPMHYNAVVAGSSMTAKLPLSDIKEWYDLSLEGGSILTGLKIIKLKSSLPDTILVETNVLMRDDDEKMVESLRNPFVNYLLATFPILLDKNQPMGYLNSIFSYYVSRHINNLFTGKNEKSTSAEGNISPTVKGQKNKLKDNMLKIHQAEYNQIPDIIKLNSQLRKLEKDVEYFSSKGVVIIFFELPMDSSLYNSNKLQYERALIKKYFLNNKYKIIFWDKEKEYTTTDGIHLDQESATRYILYLKAFWVKNKSFQNRMVCVRPSVKVFEGFKAPTGLFSKSLGRFGLGTMFLTYIPGFYTYFMPEYISSNYLVNFVLLNILAIRLNT